MQTLKVAGALALGLLIAGCGKKEEAPTETAAAPAEAPAESAAAAADPGKDLIKACEIEFTSPEPGKFTTYWDPRGKRLLGEGPSIVHSTYWANEEQRKILVPGKTPPLEVSCGVMKEGGGSDQVYAVGVSSGDLAEADLPFGPGTYPIVAQTDANNPKVKGFIAWPILYKEQPLFVSDGGTVTITRFDDKGVAGSFEFAAHEQPVLGKRVIKVKATFDMPCRGYTGEGACKAGKAIVD
ncbi:MAG TPA: hypothetical protein VMF52_19580 [Steroidobacteraceae bacterium]|nr:hypothetical protein [Steroidobacteraceae bacterium]